MIHPLYKNNTQITCSSATGHPTQPARGRAHARRRARFRGATPEDQQGWCAVPDEGDGRLQVVQLERKRQQELGTPERLVRFIPDFPVDSMRDVVAHTFPL